MMSSRERWLAALRLEPVDRLPFWPKLDGAYPRAHAAPFRDMQTDAVHDWIGSDKHTHIAGCTRETRRKTAAENTRTGDLSTTLFKTGSRTLELVSRFDPGSNAWHPMKHPVSIVADVRAMEEWYADCEVELDRAGLEKGREQAATVGSSAVTANGIGTSPMMHWVQTLAGIENAHFLLADHAAEVEALFAAMHRLVLRRAEIMAEHWPGDMIYCVENTSTTLISPEQYRRYCHPFLCEYGRIISGAGKLLVLHMCGHLKALLPMLAKVPAAAFEAFTSPKVGDTTLLDGRTACADKCLIGGTNATLWLRPAGEIIARLEEDLGVLPHHRGIVVTSAGVMPPFCKPETIKAVCEWVKSYPATM